MTALHGLAHLVCEDEVIHPDVFVARNPHTSPVALFRFTTHVESSVRPALASRRDLPVHVMEELLSTTT